MAERDELMLRALTAFREGRAEEAEGLLNRVVQTDRSFVDAHVALGTVAAATGRKAQAMERMRDALKIDPTFGPALEWLTILNIESKDFREAEKYAKRGNRIAPQNPFFLKMRGRCVAERGASEEALAIFDQALVLDLHDAEAHFARGTVLRKLNREAEALEAVLNSIRIAPEPVAYIELAEIQIQMGRLHEALEICESLDPASTDIDPYRYHLTMARALTELGRLEEAESHWNSAEASEHGPGDAALEKSFSLGYLGHFEDALAEVRRSSELQPKRGSPYRVLFFSRRVTTEDRPSVDRLEGLVQEPGLDDRDRVDMFYALGKAYNDLGEYELALKRFDAANSLKKRTFLNDRPFDRETFRRFIDFQIEVFTRETLRDTGEEGADLPLFVIGMMRSGTTLVEQVLSCHPDVGGSGEHSFWLYHVGEVIPGRSQGIDWQKAAAWKQEYVRLLTGIAPGYRHVIDKNPANLLIGGLLHTLYPSSRIVCTKRHAVDTALSIWMTQMSTGAPFICDRADIVFAYKEALRLMEHWRNTMPPSRYLQVEYEELTRDPQGVVPGILEFCGLDWNEACLHPEANPRLVRTPSFWQVRQPLYTSSVDRWKRYRPWLREFEELIGI